jgi:hypothetical protein
VATVADLKTRVADELTRDDLGTGGEANSALLRAIDTAIEYYADELRWDNSLSDDVTTSGGSNTVSLPAGMRYATQVSYLEEPLIHDVPENLEPLTETGVPARWAMSGDNIYLWPQPDGAYSLSVQGVADADSTTFATQALYDLTAARVKVILCRFPFRDDAGESAALREEMDALARVRRESRLRRTRPMRADDDLTYRRIYNINTDR